MQFLSLTALAALASTVVSHGIITSPTPRAPGPASLQACGPTVTNIIKGDNTSHVEDLPEAAAKDKLYQGPQACTLWLCRGLQAADNTKNVQSWTVGQKVTINVSLRIKHVGSANVSIVDTKTNSYVKGGAVLVNWPSGYADEAVTATPKNQTTFDVTIPDLGGACKVAGECVLQWWWYGTKARQTYESCLDFTIAPTTPSVRSRMFNM
ncbi:hypothetical protein HYALB_00012851 [Hymenoscyphus albidus]|uniref:Chitin-binding type-4 domain-containing protein n=1 Tax=Hymenoscyphus albidus TaxID=595503 RepID=A0A9N9LKS4_9HELO|nr:hypothetical protein HYALB_00012851 [Hymenoscyphus albidus]